MFKQVAVASATASLLLTMAAPALAATGESNSSGNRVRIHRSIGERQQEMGSKRAHKNRGQGQREDVRVKRPPTRAGLTADQQKAIKDARTTFEAALSDARGTREAAYAQAKSLTDVTAAKEARAAADKEYREARTAAQKVFRAERKRIIKDE
jgi:hypothetical protein